ncbi:MAG: TIGR00266 family protein [Planctomycetales bacterium]
MEIEILNGSAYQSALVHLYPGDEFVSESGAMYRASSNVDIDVTTKSRGSGGILGGLKRLLASEGFFFSTYKITDGKPGEVGLAPTHAGEIKVLELNGSTDWLCAGGSYFASSPSLKIDTQFQGFKGFFTGESMSFVRVSGVGTLLTTAFGRIVEMEVKDDLVVDTGHVVAFEETLNYTITKAGGSWIQSWLAGEGMVLNFSGTGRILVQSHNLSEFGGSLGPLLPAR